MEDIIQQLKESIEDLEVEIENGNLKCDDIIIYRSWGQVVSLGDCANYLKNTLKEIKEEIR